MKTKIRVRHLVTWMITVVFGILLLKRVLQFESLYFRFQLIPFVYENKLRYLFFVLGACELIICLLMIMKPTKLRQLFIEIAFIIYTVFQLTYFGILYFSDACLECNYHLGIFHESMISTLSLVIFCLLVYLAALKKSFPKKQAHPINNN